MTRFQKMATLSAFAIGVIHFPTLTYAQERSQNLLQCRKISGDSARLACYDDIANQMNSLIGKPETNSSQPLQTSPLSNYETKAEPEAEKKGLFRRITGLVGLDDDSADRIQNADADNFGKEETVAANADEMIMTIGKVQIFDAIKRRFYMTNGQVWEQKTGVNVNIDEGMHPSGVEAHIEDSGFSGYTMKLNGEGNKIKVKRVL